MDNQTHALILQLIQTLMEIGITVVVPFVVKYLISKIGVTNYQKYTTLANLVVQSIEQTMPQIAGVEKKKVAEEKLSFLLKGKLSEVEIDHLLESAVFQINQNAQKTLKDVVEPPVEQPQDPQV